MPRVPTTKEVIPGACVNIVLKADQPTGRTVQGNVSTLLTRGNHPRGIKVRLTDGRVGRVQSIGDGSGNEGSIGPASAGRESRRMRDSEAELPPQNIGLDAYITRGKQRKNGRKQGPVDQGEEDQVTSTQPSETVTCPVCGEFNGDEAAVAHHVATHFD